MDCCVVYNGREIECNNGDILLNVLRDAGVFIDAPCSGNGKCGKCKVRVFGEISPKTENEKRLIKNGDLLFGVRLACETKVLGKCVVESVSDENTSMGICEDGEGEPFKVKPRVKAVRLSLKKAGLDNQISQYDNLKKCLAEKWVFVENIPLNVTKKLADIEREKEFCVLCDDKSVLDVFEAESEKKFIGVAVDIGTTTVVAYFYDLESGMRLAVKSSLNPQRTYGADVISRIHACMQDGENLVRMQSGIVGLIDSMCDDFCSESGISKDCIADIAVCGNTTMMHLFCGIKADSIAAAPFISVSKFGFDVFARELGFKTADYVKVRLMPCISGYVGADITSGILSSGFLNKEKPTLIIDIGTNGEMALSNCKSITSCSTAAGPAFEGAHIECGTGGIPGAVSKVWIDGEKIKFETIDSLPAVGICGSGLIDAVAVMLECGAVDETGRLCDCDEVDEWVCEYLDDDEGVFYIDKEHNIYITAQDIREIQLAKAAISAGILTMLDYTKVGLDKVEEIYLAGGFGAHINKENACKIGLLPRNCADKVKVIGNAAGMGAVRYLLSSESYNECVEIVNRSRYIELSSSAFFQEAYMEEMMFETEDDF